MTEAEDGVTPRPRPSPFLASASARPPAALLGLRADVVEVNDFKAWIAVSTGQIQPNYRKLRVQTSCGMTSRF
ncbi:hypothetical protein VULLAG_LOCUS8851 [Vulpes lagopus]